MKRLLAFLTALMLVALPVQAQVTNNGPRGSYAGPTKQGIYAVHVTTAYTAVESLINLEASVDKGFRITKMCIQPGSATAATYTLWQLIRTTTASSGGTAISNEGTTTNSVTKFYSGDVNWAGTARTGGTEGTSGAVIDQGNIFVGSATTASGATCIEYCTNSTVCPTVQPGTTNGVKLMFTGTAGGAGQSATIYFASE